MTDFQAMRQLRQRLATSALLVTCEGIAASGYLPGRQEEQLRRLIADVRSAFGPDIPEREASSNVIRIGDHDAEKRFIQALDDAVDAEMRK